MSRRRKAPSPARILLTKRALRDIRDIESYSVERWGRATARKYVDGIESALDRIAEKPNLLREEPQFAQALRFYRVGKHVLACDVQGDVIHVLAVLHTSMDIPSRLARLQPQLALEAGLLHDKLSSRRKDS
jgi:toxin ParE1/3/4